LRCSRDQRQPTLPQAVWRKPPSLLPLLPVKQWYRLRQYCSFAMLLFFLIDEDVKPIIKINLWACKLPQQPQVLLYFEDYYGCFGLQKKLIRLPCKVRYTFRFIQGQSNKFFSPLPVSNTLKCGNINFKTLLFFLKPFEQ
jgi:hypothetical protein